MNFLINKSQKIEGQITVPGSKSLTIRNLFVALLAQGETVLTNVLNSDDTANALHVCQQLGAKITCSDKTVTLFSNGANFSIQNTALNTGNSGISTRFILPILGLRMDSESPIIVDCGEQMRNRPINSLVDALNDLGMKIQYKKKANQLPLSVMGRLKGGYTEVNGITSQYISSLLLALPCAIKESEIKVKNLNERPYMEMTLDFLKKQNVKYEHRQEKNVDIFHIQGGHRYKSMRAIIPGDFSSASYIIASAALSDSNVALTNLNLLDTQGDKKLLTILEKMGATIYSGSEKIVIKGGSHLHGIEIDANDIPDLLPTLAVIGTQATGKTTIFNVPQARIKETDRIHSMVDGLKRLGAKIEEFEDGITVYQSKLKGAVVNGYDDHRTVMALTIAGMLADNTTTVQGSEAVNKTFPEFAAIMKSLGANIEVVYGPT